MSPNGAKELSASFDLESPTRVTVGAVGPPGQRVFYLQARQEDQLMSLKLEKEQVLFLAGGLTEVMADLAAPVGVPTESELELEQPVLAEWAVGSMQLAYDSTADRVLLVAREVGAAEDDPEETGEGAGETGEEGRGPRGGWRPAEDEQPGPGDTAVARLALTTRAGGRRHRAR